MMPVLNVFLAYAVVIKHDYVIWCQTFMLGYATQYVWNQIANTINGGKLSETEICFKKSFKFFNQ